MSDELDLDRLDLKILYILLLEEKLSPLKSLKVYELIDKIDMKTSYVSLNRRIVKKLVPSGYVNEGYKDGRSKTYYLSNEGRKYFEDKILSKEKDAFELIEIDNEEENDNE